MSLTETCSKKTPFASALFLLPAFATLLISALCTPVFAEGEEYILQPGDVITINVVEHPEFSGRNKIRPDGRINIPVVGELDVASLTCAQLVKITQGKLAPYVNNPVVSVAIEAYYSNKIFIIGDVNRTGEFEIYEPVEIIKAVAMCGGLKNSKTKSVRIIRGDGAVVPVNMVEIMSGRLSKRETSKYLLYPGDTMYVPESFAINWALISTILGIISISVQILYYTNYLSK